MKPIKTNCPRDCYDGCGIIVEVPAADSGDALRVLGDPDHPVSRGRLCSKCAVAYNGSWQDPALRLTRPARRTGAKGAGEFEPISWSAALELLAAKLHQTIADFGPEAILHTHYSGTCSLIASTFPCRLFNYLGATEVDPDSICNAAGHVAWQLMFGTSVKGFDPRMAAMADCVLVWGANPAHSAPHAFSHWLAETPAKVVVIDPVRTTTADAADVFLQPRPGTDAALAFGLLHVLQLQGKFDLDFISQHTLGFDAVVASIAQHTPEVTARITGVAVADLTAAATLYGRGPALLWAGQGLQRQQTGGNIMRAVGLLPALTGNVGKPGAGFYYLNSTAGLAGMDLAKLVGVGLGQGAGIAVSHMNLAERLQNPEEFKVFVSWNTNPLASAADQQRLRQAYLRDDLFTVAIDCFHTDTVTAADLILPAAGFLEFDDLTSSYFHLFIGAQSKVREPMGQALPNQEIFRRLASALGLTEPELFTSDVAIITELLQQWGCGLSFQQLQQRGYHYLSDEPINLHQQRKFSTPSGRIEITSAQAVAMGQPLAPTAQVDAAPDAGWWRLLTPASKWRLNDSYANDVHLQSQAGPATVLMHPQDAERYGIGAADRVELSNAAGSLVIQVELSDAILPGTLLIYKGRWPSLEPAACNPNILHQPIMSDMGQSSSVHGTLVRLQPLAAPI